MIEIPFVDNDEDIVRCRKAAGDTECASICNVLPASSLDSNNCMLTFDTKNLAVGSYYGVALQIEDYANASSTRPISSTPLQFLIQVVKSTNNCTKM